MKSYFFWRSSKLMHVKVFNDLYIFTKFIFVLTKKLLTFLNKYKIQFKGMKSYMFLDSLCRILVSNRLFPLDTTRFNTHKIFKSRSMLNFTPMKHCFRMHQLRNLVPSKISTTKKNLENPLQRPHFWWGHSLK